MHDSGLAKPSPPLGAPEGAIPTLLPWRECPALGCGTLVNAGVLRAPQSLRPCGSFLLLRPSLGLTTLVAGPWRKTDLGKPSHGPFAHAPPGQHKPQADLHGFRCPGLTCPRGPAACLYPNWWLRRGWREVSFPSTVGTAGSVRPIVETLG